MTNKEIQEMIKKYESKWGRLGHTNIMRPELNHSGEEGGTTMSSMTNDLIAFRQKVAAGREKNKLAHKSTVNVTDINRRYFEEITTNGTLIHAGTNQNADYKYYQKLDLGNGQSRYFYTKAEWDAYQEGLKRTAYDDQNKVNAANKTSGGAKADAARENAKRNAYENTKSVPAKNDDSAKPTNNNVLNRFNNMRADVVNEYAKIAREGSSKDAAKAFYDMGKGGNEAIDELYSTIQEGFKSGKLSYKDGRFETDDDQLKDDIEAFSDNIQKFAKQIGEASGKGREIQDELEKLMLPDIEAMSNENKYSSKISKNKDADDDQKVKEMIRNKADAKSIAKELVNGEKATKYLQGLIKEAQAGNYDFSRRDIDDVDDRDSMDENVKHGLKNFKNKIEDYITDELKDLAKAQGKDYKKEFENVKDEYSNALLDRFEEMFEVAKKNNPKLGRISKLKEGANKSEVKHSSEEPEIMDEYSAFMERVKKGREKNKLAHSIMISPSDLNARYEQSIKDHCFLVHSGNFKYYNKIDLGNGQSRYFYTKAEWDAYQEGLKQTAQAKQNASKKEEPPAKKEEPIKNPDGWSADKALKEHFDKKKEEEGRAGMAGYADWKKNQEAKSKADERNNMAGYADWKKEQDTKKQQEETVAKNKAADEAIAKKLQQNSTIIKKQLQEQYEKNKEAAKHEGDRWAKTITEATKVADAPGKDAEIKPEQKQPPVQMEEQAKQEVAQETIPKDTAYTNVLNNILNDQNINDWAYICAVRSVYGANEENEKAVWELQAYLDNVLNQVYTEIGSMYGEAAITEIDGILGNQLQMLYQNYYNQVLNDFTMTANQQAMNQMMFGY